MGYDAVYAHSGRQLLSQQSDRDLGQGNGVRGVDALFRIGRRVGCLTAEGDVGVGHREGAGLGDVDGRRVGHHREVKARERPSFQHLDLASAAFLRRRAVHLDGQPEVVCHLGQARSRSQRGGGYEVMPARVAQPGERVVFRAQADAGRAVAVGRVQRGLQSEETALYGKPEVDERLADPRGRSVLFPCGLRVRVQPLGQAGQPVFDAGDGSSRGCLLLSRARPRVRGHREHRRTAPRSGSAPG